MKQNAMPQAGDWDRFWGKGRAKSSSNISWSKQRILGVLEPYLNPGKRVLDAGCGSGFFSKHFCDKGLESTALDYSERALAMTREATQGRATLLKKDLLVNNHAFDIPGEKFDIIFSDGLFEHFPKSQQDVILHNLSSVLRNDGVLVTFVPNKFSPWELIRPFMMPGIEESPFVLKELVDLNRRNDLQILDEGGINTLPFRFSLEGAVAKYFGMLLFTIAQHKQQ